MKISKPKLKEIAGALLSGNRRVLAQLITLAESSRAVDREAADRLLQAVIRKSGEAVRIGITGSPGAGKSTLIEALGMQFIRAGKKVAVLAMDPSSPVAGGSILGDKTRMQEMSASESAFIRPSPSGDSAGGVLGSTRVSIPFCEAAGYEVIFVETVGAGQSEYAVASMVDLLIFVHLPNSGDELQGIKKGVLELADIVVVGKADGDLESSAQMAKADLQRAISLSLSEEHREKVIHIVSAKTGKGIAELKSEIEDYFAAIRKSGQLAKRRQQQVLQGIKAEIRTQLLDRIFTNKTIQKNLKIGAKSSLKTGATPYQLAKNILKNVRLS